MKKTMTKRVFVGLAALAVLMVGCFEIKNISQPTTAGINSSFEAKMVVTTKVDENTSDLNTYATFGVMLPEGWTVDAPSGLPFTKVGLIAEGTTEEQFHFDGTIVYDAKQTQLLNDSLPPLEGYYWWGGISTEKFQANKLDSAYCTIKIKTDAQVGEFFLSYAMGDCENLDADNRDALKDYQSDVPITVSATSGVRKNISKETFNVMVSGKQLSILLNDSKLVGAKLTVLNMNGLKVKSAQLVNASNYVDLSSLTKGTYLVRIEQNGSASCSKILLD